MKKSTLFLLIILTSSQLFAQPKVKRVILFGIDGLHWAAPEKLNMPAFNELIKEGTYIHKSYMIIPHHPTIGDYSNYYSCSFPNPVLHEGTIFLNHNNRMIQEVFPPGYQTAFIVNVTAYSSVGRGFSSCIMDGSLSDNQVVDQAIEVLKTQNPVFMRVHLQTPGGKGFDISQSSPEKPYYRNIFGKESPYVSAIENADRQLGRFVAFLKKSGLWNETVLIVTSDHGQSNIGWHSMFDEDSWMTPLVFAGSGIAKNRSLPYFEHTDIAPTIAYLLGFDKPSTNGGAGVAVKEIVEGTNVSDFHPPMYIRKINEQIREFNLLKSKMIIAAQSDSYYANVIALLENENATPEPFYHQDRILEWNKAGTVSHLIEANEKILVKMRKVISGEKYNLKENK
jgi:hypothetical protein